MRSERRRGGVTVVFLAAVLPLCFAGWLLWQSAGGSPVSSAASSSAAEGSSAGRGPDTRPGTGSGAPDDVGRKDGNDVGGSTGQAGRGRNPGDRDRGSDEGPGSGGDRGEDGGGPAKPLAGKVVVLDPGHNPGNRHHTTEITRKVDAGPFRKECDTTGTATNDGYAEASFTLDVARRAREMLRARGAKVVFTQDGDRPWGPCVDERARVGNEAGADAAVSIHADGSAAGNHGFHVIVPGPVRSGDADTRAVTGPSRDLGERLRRHFAEATSLPRANYVAGGTGIDVREDLGGLNLSTVPKVFIECGNMRNSAEAAKLRSPGWRQKAAKGITEGISAFLVNDA